jgi:hypothetical protein
MRKLKLIILLVLFGHYVYAEKVATFHDFFKPGGIEVDKTQIYITEGTTMVPGKLFLHLTDTF